MNFENGNMVLQKDLPKLKTTLHANANNFYTGANSKNTQRLYILGTVYHHAYTQTPQKKEKVPPEKKTCRDTQTAEERAKIDVSDTLKILKNV